MTIERGMVAAVARSPEHTMTKRASPLPAEPHRRLAPV